MTNIVCFGEVLWDVFPDYEKIGGAPLNVALRLNSFNNIVTMISGIGKDNRGKELLKYIESEGLNGSHIQINEDYKTSEVKVSLDKKGTASYTIEFPCAWDFIKLDNRLIKTVNNADAFIFGSLIARNSISYHTLLELLAVAKFKIFDVNLRPPHYKPNDLLVLMEKADFIKFNDEELFEICNEFNFKSDDVKKNIEFISKLTNTTTICVTLGGAGAILLKDGVFYKNNGYKVTVKDTVGAGDSFLASLCHKLLKNEQSQNAIDFACAVGALVASSVGANPKISNDDIVFLMESK
jgi:fructokinase